MPKVWDEAWAWAWAWVRGSIIATRVSLTMQDGWLCGVWCGMSRVVCEEDRRIGGSALMGMGRTRGVSYLVDVDVIHCHSLRNVDLFHLQCGVSRNGGHDVCLWWMGCGQRCLLCAYTPYEM
ncbi:hypothetical protein BO70DRAFT_62257 [Aspergillus heteromorphus CBS 117.55]|uniref:Uncharacterized protein n=1 Tax=Aspergillus heteromorphus CBS 117.55 TaxID=1448321 RepID=A0A317VVB7_9EURO|nr:uncharacterized protein BO70DRAFT_62257 [Aspergillus heteromorphus CBS 117.55]PWY78326.1 hypothetical protein BO70DRAFT_62257 [Aspergillus heteromorphus CBS 117.55]